MPTGRRKVLFDTHGSLKKLVAGGMPRQQADAYACLLIRLIGQKIATDKALDALGLKSPAIGGGTQGAETCQIGGPRRMQRPSLCRKSVSCHD